MSRDGAPEQKKDENEYREEDDRLHLRLKKLAGRQALGAIPSAATAKWPDVGRYGRRGNESPMAGKLALLLFAGFDNGREFLEPALELLLLAHELFALFFELLLLGFQSAATGT